MTFIPGDKVTVNGLPATILVYDEVVNQLVFESELPGGATNTTYGHISNSDIRAIDYVVHEDQPELPVAEDVNPVADAPQEVGNVEASADENEGSEK